MSITQAERKALREQRRAERLAELQRESALRNVSYPKQPLIATYTKDVFDVPMSARGSRCDTCESRECFACPLAY